MWFLEIGNLYRSFFFKFEMTLQQTAENCYQVTDMMEAEEGSKIWRAIPNRFLSFLFSVPSKSEGHTGISC